MKKKHLIFILCCMASLIVSCNKQQDPPEDDPLEPSSNELRFGVSSVDSKAAAVRKADDILSMGIFGYSTGTSDFNPATAGQTPNLLYNQLAERTSSSDDWVYDPIAYWPMDLSIKNTFFAYSPHSSAFPADGSIRVSPVTASGYPTLTYTISETVSEQQDILYATPVQNKNRNSADSDVNGGEITYKMKHALTWLAFVVAPVAYTGEPDETYTVKWLNFMADRMPTTATLNLGTGTWNTPSAYGAVSYEFELSDAAEDMVPGQAANIVANNSPLMLFPIDINSTDSKATIDMTFYHNPGGGDDDSSEYYYYMPFPTQRMTAGNVIMFVINMSVDGITVKFLSDNTIEEWIQSQDEKIIEIY